MAIRVPAVLFCHDPGALGSVVAAERAMIAVGQESLAQIRRPHLLILGQRRNAIRVGSDRIAQER